jgi:hypothetical protein
MKKAMIAGAAFTTILVLLALAAVRDAPERHGDSAATTSSTATPATAEGYEGLLYGRVTATDGGIYEGRLRFGGDEESLWGNYFNGFKDENPWTSDAPPEGLPRERLSIEAFGFEIAVGRPFDLGRPFMARFGDITRIEARGRDLRVTLKSGTVVHLDRYAADDFADGVRVWDGSRGVVDLHERRIRSIELLSTAPLGHAPPALHGTVRARQGTFTGLVQWDREASLGSDMLTGRTPDGELSIRFDAIRSIARRSGESAALTLLDGREIVLSATRPDGRGNRGMYVDDPRYGRVLVSWQAFERVDFGPGGAGPAYGDFPPGRPLTGSVTTRSGHHLAGRLVYDLDESETTETMDAPSQGVDYTIPFGLIASIVAAGAEDGDARGVRVILHDGEELQLERTGDLGDQNAGILIFVDGLERSEYVPWADVEQIHFDRPPATFPASSEAGAS